MYNILAIIERPGQVVKGMLLSEGQTKSDAETIFNEMETVFEKKAINSLWLHSFEYGQNFQTLIPQNVLEESTIKMAIVECGENPTKLPTNI